MAVSETLTKRTASLTVKPSGAGNETYTVNFGALAINNWDAQKVMNIVLALDPILEYDIVAIEDKPVYSVVES